MESNRNSAMADERQPRRDLRGTLEKIAAESANRRTLARAVVANIDSTTPGGLQIRSRFPWGAVTAAAVLIAYCLIAWGTR